MHSFRASASSSLLALPRPSYCPSVGSYVALKAGEWPGPLAPCDYGIVLEDTGIGSTPYLVGAFTARLACSKPVGYSCLQASCMQMLYHSYVLPVAGAWLQAADASDTAVLASCLFITFPCDCFCRCRSWSVAGCGATQRQRCSLCLRTTYPMSFATPPALVSTLATSSWRSGKIPGSCADVDALQR
jgi:hypothetical protein